MKQPFTLLFSLLLGLVVMMAGCGQAGKEKAKENSAENTVIQSVKELAGKRVGIVTGSAFVQLTEPFVDNVEYLYFNDENMEVEALRTDKVDAVLLDEPVARNYAAKFPDECYLACVYAKDQYAYAFAKGSPLTEQVSEIIRQLQAAGELDTLREKWCGADADRKTLTNWTHRKDFTGKNGTLRFACVPTLEPMCYVVDGQLVGLDIELMRRIAYELDMLFEPIPMGTNGLLEAVISGKVDAGGSALSITEERKEKVDFSECHYNGGLSILARKAQGKVAATTLSQLEHKRIGVVGGTTYDVVAHERFPDAEVVYLTNLSDMPVALNSGKVDAILTEEPIARLLDAREEKLHKIAENITEEDYAFIFAKSSQQICDQVSRELRRMREDGTLAKLEEKWFSNDESQQTTIPCTWETPNGVLKYVVIPELEPFTFYRKGKVVGYDIDILQLLSAALGYKFEPVIGDCNSYIEAVTSGKVDLGIGCISITEERKQRMLFTAPIYRGGVAAVVSERQTADDEAHGHWFARAGKSLKDSFIRTFVNEDRWEMVVDGLGVTVLITLLSALFGTLLAFGICAMRMSKNGLLSGTAKLYISLMQGMPILVILMILYYVIFAKTDINAVVVAVIGFSMNMAAYVGEMLRSGINSIPKGQTEAALALGFSKGAAFRKVILPQVLRRIMPVYRGEFISLLKSTSMVGYIAIQDLTKMSDIIRSRTYEAFFPLITTAIIYFVTALLLASLLSCLDRRLDPIHRRTIKKGGRK